MKKTLLFAATAVFGFGMSANAQSCLLDSDTVVAGSDSSQFTVYSYDGADNLIKAEFYDSATQTIQYYDTLFYGGSGLLDSVHGFWTGSPLPNFKATLTYNVSDQIIRIHNWGDNGSGPWTMAHDISYNGSGQPENVILDPFSISGSPEGFMANWENITWVSGNATTVDMVGDLGADMDTLELIATSDAYNNLQRLLYVKEAGDMIDGYNTNNMVQVEFAENELFGPAGTIALQRNYTYTPENEVATRENMPGIFDSDYSMEAFRYNCTSGLNDKEAIAFKLFPNPAGALASVTAESTINSLIVRDLNGKMIANVSPNTTKHLLDVSGFAPGIYMVTVVTDEGIGVEKLIVM